MYAQDPSFRGLRRRSIYFPIGMMVVLLFVLGALVVVSATQTRQVNRMQVVLAQAESIYSLIINAEDELSGFGVTKNPQFLASYEKLGFQLPPMLARMRSLVTDDPLQVDRLKNVDTIFGQWKALDSPVAQKLATKQHMAVGLGQGLLLDEMRGGLSQMVDAEQQRLSGAMAAQQSYAILLLVVLGGGTILAGVLLAYQSAKSIKEVSYRYEQALALVHKQSAELRESRDELDRRVEERTKELNAVNRELEVFCYSAAHDLRAPLRWILGTNKLFIEDYGSLIPPEGIEDLGRVNSAASRLSKLIDNLLEMARIGRADLKKIEVDFTQLCADTLKELQTRDWGGPVEIEVQPNLKVKGDPLLLSVLVQNLLENACKFSGKTGCGKVELSASKVDGEVVYSVKDNGVGFDPAFAGKLFQPFERLHKTEQFAGTGMGLANAKRIVERHGGRIWAEGKPDEGATFSFTLP